MSPDKFKSIVHAVMKAREVHLSSFGESEINAIAREYSTGKTDSGQAIAALQSLFASHPDIDRHDYAEMEKRLQRY